MIGWRDEGPRKFACILLASAVNSPKLLTVQKGFKFQTNVMKPDSNMSCFTFKLPLIVLLFTAEQYCFVCRILHCSIVNLKYEVALTSCQLELFPSFGLIWEN